MSTSRLIVLVLFCSLLSSFVAVQALTPTSENKNAETVFDRVQRTRTLRCGYAVIPSVLNMNKETKALSGPAFDLIATMANNLKLKVEWTAEAGFASVAEDLKNGKFDLMCVTLGTNAARGQVMDTSRPVVFLPFYLWVHVNSNRNATDLSWVNDPTTTLSNIDGTIFTSLYAYYFPKAKVVSLPELSPLSDQILQVATGKADATLMHTYEANMFLANNPGTIKMASHDPVMIASGSFWMKKGDERFKSMIDIALTEMLDNGTIDKIWAKYEPKRGYYYWRVAPDYERLE
jgi:ABC-type amino acid transport substrate-binding protein